MSHKCKSVGARVFLGRNVYSVPLSQEIRTSALGGGIAHTGELEATPKLITTRNWGGLRHITMLLSTLTSPLKQSRLGERGA